MYSQRISKSGYVPNKKCNLRNCNKKSPSNIGLKKSQNKRKRKGKSRSIYRERQRQRERVREVKESDKSVCIYRDHTTGLQQGIITIHILYNNLGCVCMCVWVCEGVIILYYEESRDKRIFSSPHTKFTFVMLVNLKLQGRDICPMLWPLKSKNMRQKCDNFHVDFFFKSKNNPNFCPKNILF